MAITIAEAQQRRTEALRIELENNVLRQWYGCLSITLVEQIEKELKEPDFSSHWLMCPTGLLDYLRANGVTVTVDNWHEPVEEYINSLIGDQLEEYGIEVRMRLVHGFMESANRFYLLKPGQRPTFN